MNENVTRDEDVPDTRHDYTLGGGVPVVNENGPLDWVPFSGDFGAFCDQGLNKPGIMVRTGYGDTYLLGEVNCLGGRCDCCPELAFDTTITAYKNPLEIAERKIRDLKLLLWGPKC